MCIRDRYRTPDECDTKNRQHVCLIRDLFIDWLGERVELCSYPWMLAMYISCAHQRLRERCIVPIDVPCRLHPMCPFMGTAHLPPQDRARIARGLMYVFIYVHIYICGTVILLFI